MLDLVFDANENAKHSKHSRAAHVWIQNAIQMEDYVCHLFQIIRLDEIASVWAVDALINFIIARFQRYFTIAYLRHIIPFDLNGTIQQMPTNG